MPLLPFSDADDGHNNNTERNEGEREMQIGVPIRKGVIAGRGSDGGVEGGDGEGGAYLLVNGACIRVAEVAAADK